MRALQKDRHDRFASVQAFANAFEQACELPSTVHLTQTVSTSSVTKVAPAAGTFLFTYTNHVGPIFALAWSPDRQKIVSADHISLKIWRITTGRSIGVITYVDADPSYNVPTSPNELIPSYNPIIDFLLSHVMGWSPDGKRLVGIETSRYNFNNLIANEGYYSCVIVGEMKVPADSTPEIYEVSRFPVITSPPVRYSDWSHRGFPRSYTYADVVVSVAWSPEGLRIASVTLSGEVVVWEATTGQPLGPRYGSGMKSATWSPNGRYILVLVS